MTLETIPAVELARLAREDWRIVDVRAPIEFRDGAIPGSLNLPIMNDEERARVGTTYKSAGQGAAIALGHELVSGPLRESRIRAWVEALQGERSLLTCFRGGLRSQIAQEWAAVVGTRRPRLREGYKGARAELRAALEKCGDLIVVAGATGSGKSEILRALMESRAVLDLEACAEHRGSAFGGDVEMQPSQSMFENRIGWEILKQGAVRNRLVEDESRLIGRLAIPDCLLQGMRVAPLVIVDESMAARVERIRREYVAGRADPYPGLRAAVGKISRRLGGLRTREILEDLSRAEQGVAPDSDWIVKLLNWYYDPYYFDMLSKRGAPVLFRGTRLAVEEWLRENG